MSLFKSLAAAVVAYSALLATADAAQLVVVELKGCEFCMQFNATVAPGYGSTPQGRKAPMKRVMLGGPVPKDVKGKLIRGTPTFIVMNNGREVGRFDGFSGAGSFYARLSPLLAGLQ